MNKAYIEQIHAGLNTTALCMDTQWAMMLNSNLNIEQRHSCEVYYQGMIQTICALGGDWVRDRNGKHRVFLAGLSSRDMDEYNEEA